MTRKKRLGRGLESLLNTVEAAGGSMSGENLSGGVAVVEKSRASVTATSVPHVEIVKERRPAKLSESAPVQMTNRAAVSYTHLTLPTTPYV